MNIVQDSIQDYLFDLDRIGDFEDPVLRNMEELGDRLGFPIIGPLVGGLIYQIAKLAGAESVFELGSGFGYSTYWFAKALPDNGVVHHTDMSKENIEQAKKFLSLGKLAQKVRFHQGDALASLDKTGGLYDIIFCDIDKDQYPEIYPRVKKHLKKEGVLIVDNMLWSGRVVQGDPSAETKGIKQLTELLYADKDFFTTLIPLRDGVAISYRMR
ncbi:MAG: O-methyltransferase [Candidatus Omnitrophica bacterium]|nr:O-methyltransferase [Candidatus Omnitrophota bacterium]